MTRVAIIGAGRMATEHTRALSAIEGVQLAGVCSRTRRRAEDLAAAHGVACVCDSIEELRETTDADLVVVAVPELETRQVAERCFEYEWTCLIEKPAGYDLQDAEAIAGSARDSARRAFVALNRRHYSSTRAVLQDLEADPGPRIIQVQDQEDPAAAAKAGRPRAVVDNWMFANSIHLIDYFAVFGRGSIVDVDPVVRWDPRDPSIVAARIVFDSGDIGLYQAVWNRPGPWSVSVTTPSRYWEMRPLEQATMQSYGQRRSEPAPIHEWDTDFKPGFRRQAEYAVRAARGEIVPELPTLEDALTSMRLVQAVYQPVGS